MTLDGAAGAPTPPWHRSSRLSRRPSPRYLWGWNIYDYLVYCNYRYVQREMRWKGLEDALDECILEGARTLDMMCFSSQFYFMVMVRGGHGTTSSGQGQ